MSDICVKVEKLSKRFFVLKTKEATLRALKALVKRELRKGELWVLRELSLEVKKGEKLAIIGRNASGKTTLLRILTGIYDETSGYVKVESMPRALFRLWAGFNADLSVVDNIYLFGAVYGIGRDILEDKIDQILKMSELNHQRFSPLKELSPGQQQRLALSVFFQDTSDFLIFDEVLAYVDRGFSQRCETYFKSLFSSEKTVITTSHNTSFLKRYCKRAIWLDEGRIRMDGSAEEVVGEYERACVI